MFLSPHRRGIVRTYFEWVGDWNPVAFDLETARRGVDAKKALPPDGFL